MTESEYNEITELSKVYFKDRFKDADKLEEAQYNTLYPSLLTPTSIKIDVPLFRATMERYSEYFSEWSKNRPEVAHLRKGLPLVNMTGSYTEEDDFTIQPLDYYWEMNPGREVMDHEIRRRTAILDEPCFDPFDPIKPYMCRSSVLKWEHGGNFVPHIDLTLPTTRFRFWGTDDPDSIKIKFPVNPVRFGYANYNDLEYVEFPNVEAGRIYLVDTSYYHAAECVGDSGYHFFIGTVAEAYDVAMNLMVK